MGRKVKGIRIQGCTEYHDYYPDRGSTIHATVAGSGITMCGKPRAAVFYRNWITMWNSRRDPIVLQTNGVISKRLTGAYENGFKFCATCRRLALYKEKEKLDNKVDQHTGQQ